MEGLEIFRDQGEGKATIRQPGRHSEPTVGPLDVALGAVKAPGSPELVGSTDTSFPMGPMSIQSQEALTPGDQRKSPTSVGLKRDGFLWGLGPLMFTIYQPPVCPAVCSTLDHRDRRSPSALVLATGSCLPWVLMPPALPPKSHPSPFRDPSLPSVTVRP